MNALGIKTGSLERNAVMRNGLGGNQGFPHGASPISFNLDRDIQGSEGTMSVLGDETKALEYAEVFLKLMKRKIYRNIFMNPRDMNWVLGDLKKSGNRQYTHGSSFSC